MTAARWMRLGIEKKRAEELSRGILPWDALVKPFSSKYWKDGSITGCKSGDIVYVGYEDDRLVVWHEGRCLIYLDSLTAVEEP